MFFIEEAGVGGDFFQNSVAKRKEEALSSSGLDAESL